MPSPIRIYLDTNAVSYCLDPLPGWTPKGLEELRATLAAKIQSGEIVVIGSQFHLEEASRMAAEKRPSFITFFWDTVRWNLLLPTNQLAKLEVEMGRPLSGNEPYDTVNGYQALKRFSKTDSKLDALAQAIEQTVKTETADHMSWREEIRRDFKTQFTGMKPEEVTKAWWKDPEARFSSWLKDYMAVSKSHFGLPDDQTKWPPTSALQTIRALMIHYMARAYLNIGLQRKIGDGDRHDGHHYASACYADILVTEDKAFRETLNEVPGRKTQVTQFNDFAQLLGVAPH